MQTQIMSSCLKDDKLISSASTEHGCILTFFIIMKAASRIIIIVVVFAGAQGGTDSVTGSSNVTS